MQSLEAFSIHERYFSSLIYFANSIIAKSVKFLEFYGFRTSNRCSWLFSYLHSEID